MVEDPVMFVAKDIWRQVAKLEYDCSDEEADKLADYFEMAINNKVGQIVGTVAKSIVSACGT